MVTIEILRGESLVIQNGDAPQYESPKLRIEVISEEFDVLYLFELTKTQAETLAAVLSILAKQLD